MPGAFHGTRTIGGTGWPSPAGKHWIIEVYSCTPCCISAVPLSKPHCAIASAENPEGIASQELITTLPEAQISLTLFAIVPSLRCNLFRPRERQPLKAPRRLAIR